MDKISPRHEGMKRSWSHKLMGAVSKIGSNLRLGKFEKHNLKKQEAKQNKLKSS